MVKRILWLAIGVGFVATVLLLSSGCIGSSSQPAGVAARSLTDDGTKPEPVGATWWVNEATLSAGYPPPGPVGQIILKEYPSYRSATVTAKPGQAGQRPMFNTLFEHIQENDIAMTAPVQMEYASPKDQEAGEAEPRLERMTFLYADDTIGATRQAGDVTVADHAAVTVLSIGFRGGYDDDRFASLAQQLRRWAADHSKRVRVTGPARMLGYNSPFVPSFLRYGEVQLPVELLESSK